MISLTERIHQNRLAYIVKHFDELGLKDYKGTTYYKQDNTDFRGQLEKYLKMTKDGKITIRYKQNDKVGRFFTSGFVSLQGMRKDVRSCIVENLYHDIDIKNCHPVVLSHICKKLNIATTKLDYYIDNREKVLAQFGTSRDDAKTVILKLLNGGYSYYEDIKNKPEWFIEYYHEVLAIHKELATGKNYEKFLKKYEDKNKTVYDDRGFEIKHKNNPVGSYVSSLMCDVENKILMAMYDKLGKPETAVLCFDGIMVSADTPYDLKELERHIKRNIDIDITLVCKPIKNEIDIPCDLDLPVYQDTEHILNYYDHKTEYDFHAFRKEFNEKKFDSYNELDYELRNKYHKAINYICTGTGYFLMYEKDTNTYTTSIAESLKNNNFAVYYKNDDGKKIKLRIQDYILLKDGYKKIECKLSKANPKFFNLWSGFKATSTNHANEGCELMKKFIFETWANSNDEYYKYIISWLAGLVRTDKNNDVALVLISEQGTGKGFVYEFMKNYVIGKWACVDMEGIESVTGKYNEFIENKRLLLINEMCSTRDNFHSNFDKIKANITDPTIQIKRRYIDNYNIDNIGNYILCSNHKDSVIVSNGDRRYSMFEVSSRYKGDTSFFNKLARMAYNQEAGDAFYTYLLDFDRVDVKQIIETDIRKKAKLISLSSPMKFIHSIKETPLRDNNRNNIKRLSATALYTRYKDWASENGERCVSNTKFGLEVTSVLEKKRSSSGQVYILPEPEKIDIDDDDQDQETDHKKLKRKVFAKKKKNKS
jgi:hypothetical protein